MSGTLHARMALLLLFTTGTSQLAHADALSPSPQLDPQVTAVDRKAAPVSKKVTVGILGAAAGVGLVMGIGFGAANGSDAGGCTYAGVYHPTGCQHQYTKETAAFFTLAAGLGVAAVIARLAWPPAPPPPPVAGPGPTPPPPDIKPPDIKPPDIKPPDIKPPGNPPPPDALPGVAAAPVVPPVVPSLPPPPAVVEVKPPLDGHVTPPAAVTPPLRPRTPPKVDRQRVARFTCSPVALRKSYLDLREILNNKETLFAGCLVELDQNVWNRLKKNCKEASEENQLDGAKMSEQLTAIKNWLSAPGFAGAAGSEDAACKKRVLSLLTQNGRLLE